MATVIKLAKEALSNRNYLLAVEIFEQGLSELRRHNKEYYLLYGETLCRVGRVKDAIDVYSHICTIINYHLTIDQLKFLTYSLLENVITSSRCGLSTLNSSSSSSSPSASSTPPSSEIVDPLLCPVCYDIIVHPVTAICGHTFCRQCIRKCSECITCEIKFNENSFEQNILVKKIIEKWWPGELRASELNKEAVKYIEQNLLDDALKCCNESLEKAPNNFIGLLQRSEVLHRLSHFQSSLADADNALKGRPTSFKTYIRRAEALSSLGRYEEALTAYCIAICVTKTSNTIPKTVRHGITRILQRLLIPSTAYSITQTVVSPYGVFSRSRRHPYYQNQNIHNHQPKDCLSNHRLLSVGCSNYRLSDFEEENSSCSEEEICFTSQRHQRFNLSMQNIIPRPNIRLRTLLDRIVQEIEKTKRIELSPVLLQINPSLIESSDFDCVLCCRSLWKPVVTPCGHTYCWICLDRSMDYSSMCPLCMSPLVEQFQRQQNSIQVTSSALISLSKCNVTVFVEEAMRRFIPITYSKRQIQEMEEEPSVPIFICTTAFPTVPCPLYVFEPRYRLMVRRAIENGVRQFGIVLPKTESRYHDYGTMLDIRDCVLLGDGCSILSTTGSRRFRVLARGEKDGYDTAKIDYVFDEPIKDDRLSFTRELHKKILQQAITWYENLAPSFKTEISKSFGQMPELETNWEKSIDGPAWVWWITAILPLKQSLQTGMLATTSLEKRLLVIKKTLLDYNAAQQKCYLCDVACEGLSTCQAIDCCQRGTTSAQIGVGPAIN